MLFGESDLDVAAWVYDNYFTFYWSNVEMMFPGFIGREFLVLEIWRSCHWPSHGRDIYIYSLSI